MRKRNKLIALLLAGVMAISVAACGNTDSESTSKSETKESVKESTTTASSEQTAATESAAPEDEDITFPLAETMTFTAAAPLNGDQYPVKDSLAWQEFEKIGNINVEFTNFLGSEMKEKLGLLIAGGDYPDVVLAHGNDYKKYGMDGVYIPLEDLIREYMPNLTKILDEREGAWETITAGDGHVYGLPRVTRQTIADGNAPLWINRAWMDKLGLEDPKNLDDLYDIMVAFKTQDPNGNGKADEIPFTFTADNGWYPMHRFLPYMADGIHRFYDYACLLNTGEMVYYPITENFKEYLSFLEKCGEAGLLDPEGFVQSHEQLNAKVTEDTVYGMGFQEPKALSGQGSNWETLALDFEYMPPFVDGTLTLSLGILEGSMCITDKCENPEVLCAWIDYLYSEEGANLACVGIEGESYTINEDGFAVVAERITNGTTMTDTIYGTAQWPGLEDGLVNNKFTDSPRTLKKREEQKKIYAAGSTVYAFVQNEEEEARLAEIKSEVNNYARTYTAQVATNQVDLEATYDDFLATIKAMGGDEIDTIYKNGYARYIGEEVK